MRPKGTCESGRGDAHDGFKGPVSSRGYYAKWSGLHVLDIYIFIIHVCIQSQRGIITRLLSR
jgi:hypothetical protein